MIDCTHEPKTHSGMCGDCTVRAMAEAPLDPRNKQIADLEASLQAEKKARVKAEALITSADLQWIAINAELIVRAEAAESQLAAVRHELASEKERAEANWTSLERVKGKLADARAKLREHEAEKWCFNEEHGPAMVDSIRLSNVRGELAPMLEWYRDYASSALDRDDMERILRAAGMLEKEKAL